MDAQSEDPFENVLFPEDRLSEDGYQEGYRQGCKEGLMEGLVTGQQKGAEIASEVGFYIGFIDTWQSLLSEEGSTKDKTIRTLTLFKVKLQEFQVNNISSPDYLATLSELRAKFKQVASLLKISPAYQGAANRELSF